MPRVVGKLTSAQQWGRRGSQSNSTPVLIMRPAGTPVIPASQPAPLVPSSSSTLQPAPPSSPAPKKISTVSLQGGQSPFSVSSGSVVLEPAGSARMSLTADGQIVLRRTSCSTGADKRRLSSSGTTDDDDEDVVGIIEEVNMDGVRHLRSQDPCHRIIWTAVIVVFVALALFQISRQVSHYLHAPVSTYIEAVYPEKLVLPAVAICNNNQFRLTYITGARVQNRRPRGVNESELAETRSNMTVFERALYNTADMDVVKFLRSAAHWKSRMILGCTWPNGTHCRISDFRPLWTLQGGLCWAINTNPARAVYVEQSGSQHGLRLLLNVERYERIDSCTPHFRSASLPGLKVLIYNQSDYPSSSMHGINVPSGFAVDIPLRVQIRDKLRGASCVSDPEQPAGFSDENNARSCPLRAYLARIRDVCNCSLQHAFDGAQSLRRSSSTQSSSTAAYHHQHCTVADYFGCVRPLVAAASRQFRHDCLPPCETADYTAWQDMNELPRNMLPVLIDEQEQDDEHLVQVDDIDDEDALFLGAVARSSTETTRSPDMEQAQGRDAAEEDEDGEEHYRCEESKVLDDAQIARIKREAHRAFEKQARHQEEQVLRTRRLIARLREARTSLDAQNWGWTAAHHRGVFERLQEAVPCFADFSKRHADETDAVTAGVAAALAPYQEERRVQQLQMTIEAMGASALGGSAPRSLGELKNRYGASKVNDALSTMTSLVDVLGRLWRVFAEESYASRLLKADLSRMDRIFQLVDQYEDGRLQKRAWAEKMQSRNMRHFFADEFSQAWSAPILADLTGTTGRAIREAEAEWRDLFGHSPLPSSNRSTVDAAGAAAVFGSADPQQRAQFAGLLDELHQCATGPVVAEAQRQLKEFRRSVHHFQSAWQRLFVRELPAYLAQFEFGEEFVRDNFAAVNVFSHQMHIEHWFQDETYSFWSLACDIGGALGLFLGASLLTLIELIYLCWRHGVRGERTRNTYMWIREQSARIEPYSPLARLRRFGKKEGDEEKEGEKTRQRDEDEEDRSGTVDGADGVDDDDCWQDDTPSFQPLQGVHFRRPNSAAADLASDTAEEQQRPLLSAPGPSSSSSPLPFVVLDKIDEEASSGDGPQSKASPKTGRGLGAKLSPVLSSLGRRLDGILHPRKRADELQDDVDDSATDAEEGRAGGETKIPETEESELSPEDEPPPESTKNGEQQVLVQISEDDDDDDGVPPARREKKEEAEKTARQVNPHSKQSTV